MHGIDAYGWFPVASVDVDMYSFEQGLKDMALPVTKKRLKEDTH